MTDLENINNLRNVDPNILGHLYINPNLIEMKNKALVISGPEVTIGRLKKRIQKLQTQRDYFKRKVDYYSQVLSMQPHLEPRYKTYLNDKEERARVRELEARCKEQAKLIELLEKQNVIPGSN